MAQEATSIPPQSVTPVEQPKKAMYILQLSRDKLTEENMKIFKCLLLHIIREQGHKNIIIEVYFDENDFSPLPEHLEIILKALVTGYNLTEPEHSRDFPLVPIEIFLPQIFNNRSALLTDGSISHVFYNPETDYRLPLGLINERNADQTLPELAEVTTIDQI